MLSLTLICIILDELIFIMNITKKPLTYCFTTSVLLFHHFCYNVQSQFRHYKKYNRDLTTYDWIKLGHNDTQMLDILSNNEFKSSCISMKTRPRSDKKQNSVFVGKNMRVIDNLHNYGNHRRAGHSVFFSNTWIWATCFTG